MTPSSPLSAEPTPGQSTTLTGASWLATAAAHERDVRIRAYPEKIAAGELSAEEASADTATWSAIAGLLLQPGMAPARATGRVVNPLLDLGDVDELARFLGVPARVPLLWECLELAASRALQRRDEACQAQPDDEKILERRIAVQAILDRIQSASAFWDMGHPGLPRASLCSPAQQGEAA